MKITKTSLLMMLKQSKDCSQPETRLLYIFFAFSGNFVKKKAFTHLKQLEMIGRYRLTHLLLLVLSFPSFTPIGLRLYF